MLWKFVTVESEAWDDYLYWPGQDNRKKTRQKIITSIISMVFGVLVSVLGIFV